MKKRIFLFTLVCVSLLVLVSGAGAQNSPQCKKLLQKLEKTDPDSPSYAKILEIVDEKCGVALDHAALLAFYYSTDGPHSWLQKWPVGENYNHCTDWYGVYCNDDGRVRSIGISFNGLSGTLPMEFGHLTNLEYLRLGYNQLVDHIPPELGNLRNLWYIDLRANQLNGSIPTELGNLSYLQQLWLSGNQLNGSIPKELGDLNDLQILMLETNQLSGPIPNELSKLGNVRQLDFRFQSGEEPLTCWENSEVYQWALNIKATGYAYWDYPYPGSEICSP